MYQINRVKFCYIGLRVRHLPWARRAWRKIVASGEHSVIWWFILLVHSSTSWQIILGSELEHSSVLDLSGFSLVLLTWPKSGHSYGPAEGVKNRMHACKLYMLSRFSRVRLCVTLWTAAHQAPPSLGFSRQEYWSGLPFPSLIHAGMLSHFSRVRLCATLWMTEGRICARGRVTFHQSSSILGSNLYLVRTEETLRAKELSKFLLQVLHLPNKEAMTVRQLAPHSEANENWALPQQFWEMIPLKGYQPESWEDCAPLMPNPRHKMQQGKPFNNGQSSSPQRVVRSWQCKCLLFDIALECSLLRLKGLLISGNEGHRGNFWFWRGTGMETCVREWNRGGGH